MEKVNVTELRAHLPDFLSKVKAGHELTITARGRVIARIVPAVEDKMAARKQLKLLSKKAKVKDVVSPLGIGWEALDDCS
ncbi:MAG: type II toxin-antitoxin system prevent-host-death family antitoxin [Gammaproteobacteria bacterium]